MMAFRFAIIAPLALLALTGAAPKKAAPGPGMRAVLHDIEHVAILTTAGPIVVELDHKRAPITVKNFVRYVDTRRFDGTTFYRAMRLDWGVPPNGLVQAGLRGIPGKVFAGIAHEPTNATGILHKTGTLSMARFAPGTATADFSILLSDMPGLDADPTSTDTERQAGFAAFGRVIEGMDIVRKIWDAPLSPTEGKGALKGQMLSPPIKIISARRVMVPQSGN
jgi:peptidyl-prolyl cis-trans isomerase A (cyclophilin A)